MTPENPAGPDQPETALEATALARALGQAVESVAGVTRLEPTLLGHLGRLGERLLNTELPIDGQGVEVQLNGASAAVTVDVAASTQRPILETARDVQTMVMAVLEAHGVRCTSVTVSVLTVQL